MIIGIDGRTLQDQNYSGVGEFTQNLLTSIFELDSENEYRLFYNSSHDLTGRLPEFGFKNVSTEKYDYPNKILNYFLLKFFGRPHFDELLGGVDVFYMPHVNFLGLSQKSKMVLTIHDLSFLRYKEFFSWRKNFWHRQLGIGRLIRRANLIVAISENTKKDIIELFDVPESKIKVIYSGVGQEFGPLDKNSDEVARVRTKYSLPKQFILTLGTVEPRKNIDGLIRAFDILKSRGFVDLELVIAGGRGWKCGVIDQALKNSPNREAIRFLGYIEAKDKSALYNLATVFAFPSFYEGFGFPPLEAMACGVPVVSSFASSLPEILGDAALYVDPYSDSQLADTLNEFLQTPELAAKFRARGLLQAQKFSWTDTAKQYLDILKSPL